MFFFRLYHNIVIQLLLLSVILLILLNNKIIASTKAPELAKNRQKREFSIIDYKTIQLALQQSEERFHRLAANIPGVIYQYVLHPDGSDEFIYVSPGCREIYELEQQELLQDFRQVWAMIHPEDIEAVNEANRLSSQTLEPFDIEFRIIPISGRLKWLHVKSHPQLQSNGDIVFDGLVMDISQQKQYSLELKQAKETAEIANRAKSEFIARISHEFRTPLNSILGFTQIMRQYNCNQEEHQDYLEIIDKSGQHLLGLINSVLSMSKIEAGKLQLDEHSFDLYSLLGSLEGMLYLKAKTKQLALIFEIAPDLPQYIITDENKLRQILINLLSNAIKFTKIGQVKLRVFVNSVLQKKNIISFEIIDTGDGISSEEMRNLFEPFSQTETGRNYQEGTGLGLTISRKFVQLMGGDITVQSSVRSGSFFAFDIPVKLVDTTLIKAQVLNKNVKSLAPNEPVYRLLIVDDTWEHRQFIKKLLAPLGFELKTAENGQQAVELWQTWQPHAIFMDIQMPLMNGYDAIQAIKARDKNQRTKIIAVTASALDESRSLIFSLGCDYVITKPFCNSEIFDVLAKSLRVSYTYFETPSADKQNFQKYTNNITKNNFTIMSDEWIQKLRNAAYSGSDEKIFILIDEIPQEQYMFASKLRQLAYNYQFEEIISLLEVEPR